MKSFDLIGGLSSSLAQTSLSGGPTRLEQLLMDQLVSERRIRELERQVEQGRRPGIITSNSEVGEAPRVGIFWDWENCSPQLTINAPLLVKEIKRLVKHLGALEPIQAYLDIESQPPTAARLRASLGSLGVRLMDCSRLGRKEVADHAIMRDINAFALRFPVDHGSRSSPNTIVLISGDGDFSQTLHQLSDQGFNVVIIENSIGASEEMKASASEVHQWKNIVSIAGNAPLPSSTFGRSESTRTLLPSLLPSTGQSHPSSSRRVDFAPLISTIESHPLRHPSQTHPRQALIAFSLIEAFPDAYDTLEGEQTWEHYVSFAQRIGIAKLGTAGQGLEWIVLTDTARRRAQGSRTEVEVVNISSSASRDLFRPLITTLESFRRANPSDKEPRRSPIASALKHQYPDVYDGLVGEKTFKAYSLLAEKEGVVELGSTGVSGFEWIRLLPKSVGTATRQKNFLPLVRILSQTSSTRRATHSYVRHLLSDADFLLAGVETWKEYLKEALAAEIVVVGPTEHPTVSWIALRGQTPPPPPVAVRPTSISPSSTLPPPSPLPTPSTTLSAFASTPQARQLVEVLLTLPFTPPPADFVVVGFLLQRYPAYHTSERLSDEDFAWRKFFQDAVEDGIIELSSGGSTVSLVREHPLVVDATYRAFHPPSPSSHGSLSDDTTPPSIYNRPPPNPIFSPLLLILRINSSSQPLRAQIASTLKSTFPNIYSENGFAGWSSYAEAARSQGLVTMGAGESFGRDWISLV